VAEKPRSQQVVSSRIHSPGEEDQQQRSQSNQTSTQSHQYTSLGISPVQPQLGFPFGPHISLPCMAVAREQFKPWLEVHLAVAQHELVTVLSCSHHPGWCEVKNAMGQIGGVPTTHLQPQSQSKTFLPPSFPKSKRASLPPVTRPDVLATPVARKSTGELDKQTKVRATECTKCKKRFRLPPGNHEWVRCPLCQEPHKISTEAKHSNSGAAPSPSQMSSPVARPQPPSDVSTPKTSTQGTPRRSDNSSSSKSQMAGWSPESGGYWSCAQCKFFNPATDKYCGQCHVPRLVLLPKTKDIHASSKSSAAPQASSNYVPPRVERQSSSQMRSSTKANGAADRNPQQVKSDFLAFKEQG